ncbi:MAG: cytochrome c biogenesis heme-transporting ATPase CcmA [Aromatoleum sp.]|nr:cytochrome c biogenesis heme-transporting ATPase CcmA [Aromatoleum sp.]
MLEALDLAARRGLARLFSGLSFRIESGQALVVTGANGTGKTTLLRMLAGLSMPSDGQIRWNRVAVAPFSPAVRAEVAFAGHLPALKDELSAEENLGSMVALAGATVSRDAMLRSLDGVGLLRQRSLPARVLSQGQRRRIGLARLTLYARPLWILDEPVTALDGSGAALLSQMITGHLEAGGLVVAATHAPLDLPATRVRSLNLA